MLREIFARFAGTRFSLTSPRRKLLQMMPKSAVCAEIGVWKGQFSGAILELTTPSELHLIDPWIFQPEFPQRWYGGTAARSEGDMEKIYSDVCGSLGSRPGVKIHRRKSSEAMELFPDEYFDWVYIDGNHEYSFVKSDLENFFPKIKKGGYLTGDDYTWENEANKRTVKQAVDEFSKTIGVKHFEVIESQFLIQK